jgi:hypothetical protein
MGTAKMVSGMERKRKSQRYYLDSQVAGNFKNNERFVIKDLSEEGLQLTSNFSPIIGSKYRLTVRNRKGETIELEFQVVRVETGGFNAKEGGPMPTGVLFHVGGKLLNLDESKNKFLRSLLYI